jgi:phosphate:Na+ symporter
MSPLNSLIFGLGIFFLGLRLVGDNLKGLAGGGLRGSIVRGTQNPASGAVLGFFAGALMQSATAVTFICVSMVLAGFFTVVPAAVVIVWSNVGLTVLAFVATLPIDPAIAFVIGGSGIVMGVVRIRSWQTVAGALLGVGLILYGLHQMSAGAAPLRNEEWFRNGLHFASSSPLMAFMAGVLAAAILQSNTGATMMLITLAGAGAIPFESAALMIYGTNLGAIALRILLAAGMKGPGLQLVRIEDFFCVVSGVLMMILYYLEAAGIPLVFALADLLAHGEAPRLAVVFLLSNLLPALALLPFLGLCMAWLAKILPGESTATIGKPKFLHPQALADPGTAIDLLRRELARLLGLIPSSPDPHSQPADPEASAPANFTKLAQSIEDFMVKLASTSQPNPRQIASLHTLRSALSAVRHLEESARFFVARCASDGISPDKRALLGTRLAGWLEQARDALDKGDVDAARKVHDDLKTHGATIESLRTFFLGAANAPMDSTALFEDFLFTAQALHRLAKLIAASTLHA